MNTNIGWRSSRTRLNFVIVALVWTVPTGGQELGNKILGTLGLLAGSQPNSGFYVADRFLGYSANDLIDRNGRHIPVGLDLDAVANAMGIQLTFKLPWRMTYMNASLGFPAAHVAEEFHVEAVSRVKDRPQTGAFLRARAQRKGAQEAFCISLSCSSPRCTSRGESDVRKR